MIVKPNATVLAALLWIPPSFAADAPATAAPPWQEVELAFIATRDAANPYTDTEGWADFTHEDGTKIRRPLFWDGGRTFRVRFASTKSSGTWRWTTSDRDGDPGMNGKSGTLSAGPAASEPSTIFDALPFADMQPNWTYTYGRRGLAVPGKFLVLYLPEGGNTGITSLEVPRA